MRNNISRRMGIPKSILTASQSTATASASGTRPYRISDLIPKNWEKGEFRNLMSDLHFRMQTWSDQVEKILVR